uniref:Uncharacterized protein n=1 Tax=Lotus japonicus TaxID=34305 RepID=I3SM80_LOTJA|nr:unknown [Lotus japonicus]
MLLTTSTSKICSTIRVFFNQIKNCSPLMALLQSPL